MTTKVPRNTDNYSLVITRTRTTEENLNFSFGKTENNLMGSIE